MLARFLPFSVAPSAYLKGVFWFVLVSFVSASNDALIKLTGMRLSGIQIAFFRFFFSCITLLPFMLRDAKVSFKTVHWKVHGVRSLFLFAALAPWCYGVIALPLSLVTTLSFTTPLFTLVLSHFFLKEAIGKHLIVATCIGFVGIVISAAPTSFTMNNAVFLLIGSTILFASLDIMNKKLLIKNESLLSMLFFSALGTTVLSFPFALLDWAMPTLEELLIFFVLGIGANLILYCLLRAFRYCDVSSLQPFRYLELLISTLFGVVLFAEWPTFSTLLGAACIIPATLYVAHKEVKKAATASKATGAAAEPEAQSS